MYICMYVCMYVWLKHSGVLRLQHRRLCGLLTAIGWTHMPSTAIETRRCNTPSVRPLTTKLTSKRDVAGKSGRPTLATRVIRNSPRWLAGFTCLTRLAFDAGWTQVPNTAILHLFDQVDLERAVKGPLLASQDTTEYAEALAWPSFRVVTRLLATYHLLHSFDYFVFV
jgi:hypothetical protein